MMDNQDYSRTQGLWTGTAEEFCCLVKICLLLIVLAIPIFPFRSFRYMVLFLFYSFLCLSSLLLLVCVCFISSLNCSFYLLLCFFFSWRLFLFRSFILCLSIFGSLPMCPLLLSLCCLLLSLRNIFIFLQTQWGLRKIFQPAVSSRCLPLPAKQLRYEHISY